MRSSWRPQLACACLCRGSCTVSLLPVCKCVCVCVCVGGRLASQLVRRAINCCCVLQGGFRGFLAGMFASQQYQRPTYERDAEDDEFAADNGLSMPRFNFARLAGAAPSNIKGKRLGTMAFAAPLSEVSPSAVASGAAPCVHGVSLELRQLKSSSAQLYAGCSAVAASKSSAGLEHQLMMEPWAAWARTPGHCCHLHKHKQASKQQGRACRLACRGACLRQLPGQTQTRMRQTCCLAADCNPLRGPAADPAGCHAGSTWR